MQTRIQQSDLLPGVEGPSDRRRVSASAVRQSLESSRRKAAVEEILDCAVLIVLNLLFILWSRAQLPFVGRDGTMLVLLASNALLVGGYFRSRILPRITARRIAATWSPEERQRFSAQS